MQCIMTWFRLGKILACVLGLTSCPSLAQTASDNAVILLYHHVSDDTPKSTSISPELFAQHLAYLNKHHHVMALPDAIEKLKAKAPLPDRTVIITFDDGYENILLNAHPLLTKYHFPYTIFINPEVIGKQRNQLTWEQVKRMQQEGATFANHTLDHMHLLNRKADEGETEWLERVWDNIEQAEQAIKHQTGRSFNYLAFPFGEYNQRLAEKLAAEGYTGFAQYSGAISSNSDFSALPRFPAAGNYASLESLKTKLNSLAMPVAATSVSDPEVINGEFSGSGNVTVSSDDVRIKQLNCFFRGRKIDHVVDNNTFVYTLDTPLPAGRTRVNCTAPSKRHSGRYYWYSQPFFVADESGRYPD